MLPYNRSLVIIPTYNESNYIGKLLECLVHQSYVHFEVIIVDASSKDNTVEIVNKYKKRRFVPESKNVHKTHLS